MENHDPMPLPGPAPEPVATPTPNAQADPHPAELAATIRPDEGWRWLKWLLAGNPAYILSAFLLLYGVSRLSGDSQFLPHETPKFLFNFCVLQLYEVLLAATAVILWRRQIGYDATLLAGLDNLLVLVPFILASQAVFLGVGLLWAISLGGAMLVGTRHAWLLRHFKRLNFPRRLQWLGLALLAINVAYPMLSRWIYADGDPRTDEVRFFRCLTYSWVYLLPLLALLATWLPKASHWGDEAPDKCWLPLLFYLLWIAVTGAHLAAVGYVYSVPWRWPQLLPTLWAVAWILHFRLHDLHPFPTAEWRKNALILPALLPLLGVIAAPSEPLFGLLAAANAAGYLNLILRRKGDSTTGHGLLFSVATLIMVMGPRFVGLESGPACWLAGSGTYLLLWSLASACPKTGVWGGLTCALLVAAGVNRFDWSGYWPIQAGLIFLLLHSLRWQNQDQDARFVRHALAFSWVVDSLIWMADENRGIRLVSYATLLVLAVCAIRYLLTQSIYPRVVPVSAGITLALAQSFNLAGLVQSTPPGMAALAGSFLLFAAGTAIALTKPRWDLTLRRKKSKPAKPCS
jgi:hypothetical protein